MNLNLKRTNISKDGIFGELRNDAGDLVAYTLEHAYPGEKYWEAKVPAGVYICKRGIHTIEDGKGPFQTFEVTNVPEHTGILFHKGNYNSDSQGCILLGSSIWGAMLKDSEKAFDGFMALMDGVDGFQLTVL